MFSDVKKAMRCTQIENLRAQSSEQMIEQRAANILIDNFRVFVFETCLRKFVTGNSFAS